jgi:hypothetical protein
MLKEKKRKYYSNVKYDKKIYLVYYRTTTSSVEFKLVTDGPYKDFEKASEIMIEHLAEGVCSWVVSYEG